MLKLTCKIVIGSSVFYKCSEIRIEESWETLTDTCDIIFPKKMAETQNFKRGESVTVELGYDYTLRKVFEGYVDRVRIDEQLTLHCEDTMWTYKMVEIEPFSIRAGTLDDILERIGVKNYTTSGKIELGNYRLREKTPASLVLAAIKKDTGISIFFYDNELCCGLPRIILGKINPERIFTPVKKVNKDAFFGLPHLSVGTTIQKGIIKKIIRTYSTVGLRQIVTFA